MSRIHLLPGYPLLLSAAFFLMPGCCEAITPVRFATAVELVFEAEAVALAQAQRTRLDQHLRTMAVNRECGVDVIFLVAGTWKGKGTDMTGRRKGYLMELLKRHGIPSRVVHVPGGQVIPADAPSHEHAVKLHFIGSPGEKGCEVRVHV